MKCSHTYNRITKLILFLVGLLVPVAVKAQDLSLGLELTGSTGLGSRDLRDIVVAGIQIVLGLLGLIALVIVIYAGYMVLTANGDVKKIETGKKILIGGGIGLAIILSAYAIVTFIFGNLVNITGGNGNGGGGELPPGGETVQVSFQPARIMPAGQLSIRNVVVNVRFNKNIKPASVTNKAVTIKRFAGDNKYEDVPVTISLVDGNRLVIKPVMTCPGNGKFNCFDYDDKDNNKNKHLIDVAFNSGDAVVDVNGKKLVCNPTTRCHGEFIVGANVDVDGPSADITQLRNTLEPFEIKSANPNTAVSVGGAFIVEASAQDNSGIADVSFYQTENQTLTFIGSDSPEEVVNYFHAKSGPPGLWQTTNFAIDSQKQLIAVASDLAGNVSTSTEAVITIRPRHCFNNQLDGVGDPDVGAAPDQPETGVDCGGACGACAGASCKQAEGGQCLLNNSACASFACDPQSCLCLVRPEITEVSLDNGAPGNWVTIMGNNFGAEPGSVRINGLEMPVVNQPNCSTANNWKNNYVIVSVPEMSAGVYNISLFTSKNLLSNSFEFTVNQIKRPGICALDKDQYEVGQVFKVSGQQFGSNADARDVVLGKVESGISAVNQSYQAALVSAEVPSVQPGKMAVSVKVNNQISNSLPIKINPSTEDQLQIISISPKTGADGQYVTITGRGFGAIKKDSQVLFAGTVLAEFDFPKQCSTSYWSNNQIIAKVPKVGSSGNLNEVVKVKVGTQEINSTDKFLINNSLEASPGLCSINPSSGEVGSQVEVAGDNLKNTNLKFKDATQGITIASNNGGSYNVPAGAQTGEVRAINLSNPALVSNPLNFEVKKNNVQPNSNAAYYQWQFQTCANCYRPKVVINRQCVNGELASPSPRDGSKENFIDSLLSVTFDRLMDQESLNGNGVLTIKNCGTGANAGTCNDESGLVLSAIVNGSQLNQPSTIIINKSSNLKANTWYRIIISEVAKSVDGVALGESFSWSFKTRYVGGICAIDALSCTPPQTSISFGRPSVVSGHAYNSETCNICPNAGNWGWSVINDSVRVTPGMVNQATVVGLKEDNATGVKVKNSINAGLVGMCKIKVTAEAPQVVINNKCDIDTQSPTPYIDAKNVCSNSLVGVRFTMPMNAASLQQNGAVTIKDEAGNKVDIFVWDNITNDAGQVVGVLYAPDSINGFGINKKLTVTLDRNIIIGLNSVPLDPLSINSWTFATGAEGSACEIKDILVTPSTRTLAVGDKDKFRAYAVSASCQALVTPLSGWQWRSELPAVAKVSGGDKSTTTVEAVKNGITHIRASFAGIENKEENGLVMVGGDGGSNLKIVKIDPVGDKVCTNAMVRVTFNRPLDLGTVRTVGNNVTIAMAKIVSGASNLMPVTAQVSPDKLSITLETNNNFDINSKYVVAVYGGDSGLAAFDGSKLKASGCSLNGLSWLGGADQCSWKFDTSASLCEVKSLTLNPEGALLTVENSVTWQASVYDGDGILLNDKANWSVGDQSIIKFTPLVSVAQYQATTTAMSAGNTQVRAAIGTVEKTAPVEVRPRPEGPSLTNVEPISPPPACRNALIRAEFNAPINQASLNNHAKVYYQAMSISMNDFNNNKIHWLDDSGFKKTFYGLLNASAKYIGGKLLASMSNLVAHKVLADNGWYEVTGKWSVDSVNGNAEVIFTQEQVLPANSTIRIVFDRGSAGVVGIDGLPAKIIAGVPTIRNFDNTSFGWEFITGEEICKVAYVDVYADAAKNKKEWSFSRSDNDSADDYPTCGSSCDNKNDGDKVFSAVARTSDGGAVTSINGVYSWNWSWTSKDTSIAGVRMAEKPAGTVLYHQQVVQAENKNGETDIEVTAAFAPSAKQRPLTGSAKVTTFMCNNPWPTTSGEWQPLTDNKFNFSFLYCRDNGVLGEQDDLPALDYPGSEKKIMAPKIKVGNTEMPVCLQSASSYCYNSGYAGGSGFQQNNTAQACASYTGSSWTQTNGYAIGALTCVTGNNIYLDYTNLKAGENDMVRQYLLEVPGAGGDAVALRIYENNFQNSSADWYKFNAANPGTPKIIAEKVSGYQAVQDDRSSYIAFANQEDPINGADKAKAFALVASYNQDASAQTINIANQIVKNIRFNSNIQNVEQKEKLIRDFKRVSDLQSLAGTLQKHSIVSGSMPTLSGGTFIPAMTMSSWPSWQQTLATELKTSIPSDPINQFGACGDCITNLSDYVNKFETEEDLGKYIKYGTGDFARSCGQAGVVAAEGSCSVKVTSNAAGDGIVIKQHAALNNASVYKLSAQVYVPTTTPGVAMYFQGSTREINPLVNEGWQDVSVEARMEGNSNIVPAMIGFTSDSGKFYVDNIKIELVGGKCAGYDANTCWSSKANNGAGEFACSKNSYNYLYQYNKAQPNNSLRAKLSALTELVSNWIDDAGTINANLDSKINLIPPTGNLPVCTTGSVGVSCGDGAVNAPEICEIGDSLPFCDAGKNWYSPAVNLCDDDISLHGCKRWLAPTSVSSVCSGKTAAQCCGGYCGDAKLNKKSDGYRITIDEQCDASIVSGDKGYGNGNSVTNQYACSQTCHDVGGYCGDSTLQAQYGEQCDASVGLSEWTCSDGSAPSCSNGCKVTCNTGANPYRGLCGNNVVENNEQCDYCGNGLQSIQGQGECTGKSVNAQYWCTPAGQAGQCKWTGGFCGNGTVDPLGQEYCDWTSGGATTTTVPSVANVNNCVNSCKSYQCKTNFYDCDTKANTGCEINGQEGKWVVKGDTNISVTAPDITAPTANDINTKELVHCGGCTGSGGFTCAWAPNSAPSCSVGKCKLNCLNGYVDENDNYQDGCEKIGSSIVGNVKSTSGSLISDVTILIFNDKANDKSLLGTTVTNAAGNYSFLGIEKGKYKILARKSKFYSQKQLLTIATSGVSAKDFTLAPGDLVINGKVLQVANGSQVGVANTTVTLLYAPEEGQPYAYPETTTTNANGEYSFAALEKNGRYKLHVDSSAFWPEDDMEVGVLVASLTNKHFYMDRCGDGIVKSGNEICDNQSFAYSCKDIYSRNDLLTPANYTAFSNRDWDGLLVCSPNCQEYNLSGLSKDATGAYSFNQTAYKLDLSKVSGGDCSYGPPKSTSNPNFSLLKTKDIANSAQTEFLSVAANTKCWFRARSACASDTPITGSASYFGSVYFMPPDSDTVWHEGVLKLGTGTGDGALYCEDTSYGAAACSTSKANFCNWKGADGKIYSSRMCWVKD